MTALPHPTQPESLKPCPFCGNECLEIESNGIGDYRIRCNRDEEEGYSCGASTSDVRCESPEDAIKRWNTRPDPQPTLGSEGETLDDIYEQALADALDPDNAENPNEHERHITALEAIARAAVEQFKNSPIFAHCVAGSVSFVIADKDKTIFSQQQMMIEAEGRHQEALAASEAKRERLVEALEDISKMDELHGYSLISAAGRATESLDSTRGTKGQNER